MGHSCGSSIISVRKLLTAGHCVTTLPALSYYKAHCGLTDLSDTTNKQTRIVSKMIVHPDYNGEVAPHDIAVLILQLPLEFNINVKPVSLSIVTPVPGVATLYGHGKNETGDITDQLLTADLNIIMLDECDRHMNEILGEGHELDLTGPNLCTAGSPDGGLGACNGDSGGPLFKDGTQVGVVSWGIVPCGHENAPSVYTNVAMYLKWINEQN